MSAPLCRHCTKSASYGLPRGEAVYCASHAEPLLHIDVARIGPKHLDRLSYLGPWASPSDITAECSRQDAIAQEAADAAVAALGPQASRAQSDWAKLMAKKESFDSRAAVARTIMSWRERRVLVSEAERLVLNGAVLELRAQREQFAAETAALGFERLELEGQRRALEEQRLELESQRRTLEEQRLAFESQRRAIEDQRLALDVERRAFEIDKAQLDFRREKLDVWSDELASDTREFEEERDRFDTAVANFSAGAARRRPGAVPKGKRPAQQGPKRLNCR